MPSLAKPNHAEPNPAKPHPAMPSRATIQTRPMLRGCLILCKIKEKKSYTYRTFARTFSMSLFLYSTLSL